MRYRKADIQGMMAAALQHQQAGSPHRAEVIYRKVLKALPELPDAVHFLGLALHQMGKSAEGIRLMRKSVSLQPANPIYYNNLGLVLKAAGRLEEAEVCHREATRLQPAFAEAWYNLGVALHEQGKLPDCASAYMQAVELRPNYPKALVNLASVLKELGRPEDAVRACKTALQFKPDLPEAYLTLSNALIEMHRPEEAERWLNEAQCLMPRNPKLLIALGRTLLELGRPEEAAAACRRAIHINPDQAEAYAGLGTVAQMSGKHQTALEWFNKAIEIKPDFAPAIFGLAGSRKFTVQDNGIIAEFEELLSRSGQTLSDTVSLHFALGKIYDDRKEYDKAFEHYEAGNALMRQPIKFDRDKHATYIDDIISVFSREFVENKTDELSHDSQLPIFIIGMPRSGTTLVEQIISGHPSVKAGGELPHMAGVIRSMPARLGTPSPFPLCVRLLERSGAHALAAEYLDKLPSRMHGETRVTDKRPPNFLNAGLIAILFRNARIVHCRRDPMDVCLSIYFQLFSTSNPYAYSLRDVGAYYRAYERLMAHWRTVLGCRLHEVNYAELVDNQEAVSRRLIDNCGLDWDDRCLTFHESERQIKTASQWQVRQPIYRSSVQRWRNYEKYLGPLKEALEQGAGQLGAEALT